MDLEYRKRGDIMDVEKKRQREQETVAKIIEIYCHDHHGKRNGLCPKCEELAHYAAARIAALPELPAAVEKIFAEQ